MSGEPWFCECSHEPIAGQGCDLVLRPATMARCETCGASAPWIGAEPVYVERGPRGKWRSLPDELYAAIMARQGGTCGVAGCNRTPKTRRFHVDHDHATGYVRGLLCHWHNRILPRTAAEARAMGDYLEAAERRKSRGDDLLALTVKP